MDSLRGIPVEHKLDAFNMPRTGTTLCHPKIGYVEMSVIPLSTRMETTPTLPKYQTRNSRWHPKSITTTATCLSSKCKKHNPSRPTTHAAIPTSNNSISSQYSQPFTSLAAPKANPIFHAAKKKLFIKTHFDSRHLTSSSSFYFSQT